MDVRVTADHIREGTPNSALTCPIAWAIKEQLGTSMPIEVFEGLALADHMEARLPEIACEFVDRFDKGKHVEPIEFTLTWIDEHGVEVTP